MLVTILDTITVLGSLAALVILLSRWRRVTGRDVNKLLLGLYIVMLFYAVCIWIEWTGISLSFDVYEDFDGALLPMFWAFVLYGLVQFVMKQDLRESRENLRVTLHSIGDAVIATDNEGRVSSMNPTAERLTGWTLQDAAHRPLVDIFRIVNAQTGKPAENPIAKVLATGRLVGLANHTKLLSRDGSEYQIADAATPIQDESGRTIGVVLVFRDVTEEYQLRERIAKNEERMNLALRGADLATWDCNIATGHMIFNDRWSEMLGYPPDAQKPDITNWDTLLHPDDVDRTRESLNAHLEGRTDYYEVEHRLRHSSGEWRWVLTLGRATERDRSGRPLRVCGTQMDITDRKLAREAFEEEALRRRLLMDQSRDGIVVLDHNGYVVETNKRFAEMLRYTPEGVKRLHVSDWDGKFTREELLEKVRSVETVGEFLETRHLCSDGTIIDVEISTSVTDYRGRKLILCVCRDVTERKRTEAEKTRLEQQFSQSQKLESIGRLAGGIAHDFNNLLSPIIGYSDILMDDLSTNDNRREMVAEISSAALRARDLVRQLLAFSRRQSLEYKSIGLDRVITGFEKLLRRTIREDIDIKLRPGAKGVAVMADIGQIEQVIMNLAVNAADAMPQGGKLTIETAQVTLDVEYAASHPEVTPGPYAMLAVSDTGVGMDKVSQDRIFEPFFSTKGEMGTGLGLATVYGIIKQHGGHIYVYSEPGHGTTFKIFLPVSNKAVVDTGKAELPSEVPRGSETILLVEDNEQVRNLATAILKRQGYTVLVATCGKDALKLLADHQDQIHLLLTDVVMPEMNGRELYTRASEIVTNLRALYMSGYTDNVIVHRGVLDDGIAFIQKPFTVHALATKVREVLTN